MRNQWTWSTIVAALLCGVLPAACTGRPPSDVGNDWIVGASTEAISWLAWSPDGATLYWTAGWDNATLYAASRGAPSPVVLATAVWSYPRPTLVADGSAIFYETLDPSGSGGALVAATIAGGGTSLTDTHTVAHDLFSYLLAPDGTRVALVSASTGVVTIRNLVAGTSVDVGGYPDPTAFAPDGGILFARNAGANDESSHYLLIDTATGATTNLSFPMNQTIDWVTAWDQQRPRTVISNGEVIDLPSGSAVRLVGMGRVEGLSATPDRAFAYGWGDIDCLDPYTNAETGDHACRAFFYRLSRDDLSDGARQVIASEVVEVDNNVDLFAASRDGAWLAVAGGSGLLVGKEATAIKLKRLSP